MTVRRVGGLRVFNVIGGIGHLASIKPERLNYVLTIFAAFAGADEFCGGIHRIGRIDLAPTYPIGIDKVQILEGPIWKGNRPAATRRLVACEFTVRGDAPL